MWVLSPRLFLRFWIILFERFFILMNLEIPDERGARNYAKTKDSISRGFIHKAFGNEIKSRFQKILSFFYLDFLQNHLLLRFSRLLCGFKSTKFIKFQLKSIQLKLKSQNELNSFAHGFKWNFNKKKRILLKFGVGKVHFLHLPTTN